MTASPTRMKSLPTVEFAKRLNTACDTNPLVPALQHGRLTWFKRMLAERFDESVSVETVRKWFSGEARPTPDKMKKLATLLEADEAWLSLGIAPELAPREQKAANATVDGAVNIVAGFVKAHGGLPAFPYPDDKRATEGAIDLYAVIKGAQYAFHIAVGQGVVDGHRFVVPANHTAAVQIGVILDGDLAVRMTEITEDQIEAGVTRGGMIEVTMTDAAFDTTRIRTFSKRL